MYSRRSNVSEYVSPNHDDGRGYYFGDASSASAAAVASMPQRHSDRRSYSPIGRSGIYEIQPYISSADVHVFPESITVTPGRKTIMVGRKESPQMVPRQYQYLGSPYNAEGLEDGDFRLSGTGRRPDMVYKTTMITQVTPRDASGGRDSPLRQSPQHGRQDSRLFHISVEPTSPLSQPEYVRYSSSPEAVQRSAMRKSQSNSDWSGQGQTHYLQCSPDQRVEISFQHRPQQSNQPHQFYHDQSSQAARPSNLREQYFHPDQQQWRSHGEFGDSFHQSSRPQSRTPPPEPQAVPSRLVYSPQTPNQSIAFSKKVEKKTPSHCSSIMIVPGGAKKVADEEGSSGRQPDSETKQPTVVFWVFTGGFASRGSVFLDPFEWKCIWDVKQCICISSSWPWSLIIFITS